MRLRAGRASWSDLIDVTEDVLEISGTSTGAGAGSGVVPAGEATPSAAAAAPPALGSEARMPSTQKASFAAMLSAIARDTVTGDGVAANTVNTDNTPDITAVGHRRLRHHRRHRRQGHRGQLGANRSGAVPRGRSGGTGRAHGRRGDAALAHHRGWNPHRRVDRCHRGRRPPAGPGARPRRRPLRRTRRPTPPRRHSSPTPGPRSSPPCPRSACPTDCCPNTPCCPASKRSARRKTRRPMSRSR